MKLITILKVEQVISREKETNNNILGIVFILMTSSRRGGGVIASSLWSTFWAGIVKRKNGHHYIRFFRCFISPLIFKRRGG